MQVGWGRWSTVEHRKGASDPRYSRTPLRFPLLDLLGTPIRNPWGFLIDSSKIGDMAKKNDDLAAALNALASGHEPEEDSASESHHAAEVYDEPAAPVTPPPVARPAKVARPAPVTPAVPVARSTRPTAPASPKATATPTPTPVVEARPASRVRASAPTARPIAPATPAPPEPVEVASDSPFDHAPPDDDDAVIVPAPDQSVFAPRPKAAPAVRKARTPIYQTLEFRQTVIPIMLTSGVLAIVLGAIRFGLSDDSIFSAVHSSVAIVLIVLGFMLLGAAALNIMQVKQMLEANNAPAKAKR